MEGDAVAAIEESAIDQDDEGTLPDDELELNDVGVETPRAETVETDADLQTEEMDEPAVPELDQEASDDRYISADDRQPGREDLAVEDVQPDRESPAQAAAVEEPRLDQAPDADGTDEPELAPEIEAADIDYPQIPQYEEVPEPEVDVFERSNQEINDPDVADPTLAHNDRIERQIRAQEDDSRNFAQELAHELNPYFDDMRADQEDAVHSYFQRQQVVTWMTRNAP
jgi:hypothetical protein